MQAIKEIFLQNLRQYFRNRYTIFWSLVFPLILMTILILIFGGGMEDRVDFKISLVNFSASSSFELEDNWSAIWGEDEQFLGKDAQQWQEYWTDFSQLDEEQQLEQLKELEEKMEASEAIDSSFDLDSLVIFSMIIEEIFTSIDQDNEHEWLDLYLPSKAQSSEEFLAAEKELLAQGERDAILVIPTDFNQATMKKIAAQYYSEGEEPAAGQLSLYHRPKDQFSKIAADIVSGIIAEYNKQSNLYTGIIDQSKLLEVSNNQIDALRDQAGVANSFSMTDYLIVGIIIMTLFSSGLDILLRKVAFLRQRGILRRYFATPLKLTHFFLGLLLFVLVTSLLQLLVVYGAGRLFFNSNIKLFNLASLGYMGYALLLFITFAFMILSLLKNAQSSAALAQGLFYPMLFLGGVFFPVTDMPGFLQVIILINPVTYLVNGLRDAAGVFTSPTPTYLNVLLPGLWLLLALLISVKKFSWRPERKG